MRIVVLDWRKTLRSTIERRFAYVLTLALSLPGLIASGGTSELAAVMFVWSALALLFGFRTPGVPRSTASRSRRRPPRPLGPASTM